MLGGDRRVPRPRAREGVEAPSPKAAIRASLQVGWLSQADARLALAMADDRNLTVHTYNEELAKRIYADLAGHAVLIARWIAAMERPTAASSRG